MAINKADKVLTVDQVFELHPVSRATRWRMVQRGEFPKPIRLSPGRVGWREIDVRAWLEAR